MSGRTSKQRPTHASFGTRDDNSYHITFGNAAGRSAAFRLQQIRELPLTWKLQFLLKTSTHKALRADALVHAGALSQNSAILQSRFQYSSILRAHRHQRQT